jgi:hypothetical protein
MKRHTDGIRVSLDLNISPGCESLRPGASGRLAYCEENPARLIKYTKAYGQPRWFESRLESGRGQYCEIVGLRDGEEPIACRWKARVDFTDGSSLVDEVFTSKPNFGQSEKVESASGFDLGPALETHEQLLDFEPSLTVVRDADGQFQLRAEQAAIEKFAAGTKSTT